MSIVFAGIPALIYLAAGLPATSGGMTIGTLVAFTALQGALFRPLMGLLDVGVALTSSMALFSRVFEYLDLPVDIDDPATPVPRRARRVRGEVRFEHVGFTLPRRPPAPRSTTSTWSSPPAPRWRWSARPARARARWPRWSPGSTTRRRAG